MGTRTRIAALAGAGLLALGAGAGGAVAATGQYDGGSNGSGGSSGTSARNGLGPGPGFGFGFGFGFGMPWGGIGDAGCEVPADRRLTAETSEVLAEVKEYLDELVADDEITRRRADRAYARVVTRLSVQKIADDARRGPLLSLLGLTLEQLEDALDDGDSLLDVAEDRGKSAAEVRTALRQGRRDARAAVNAICD